MYIYLNNSEEMRDNLLLDEKSKEATFTGVLEFNSNHVHVYSPLNYPHARTQETDVEALMGNICLKHYFLKAVDVTFPKFSYPRECGIYVYGGAKAELRPSKYGIRLKIETSMFNHLGDMVSLEEMIYAGEIRPQCSYETKQVRRIKIYFAKLLKKITKK